MTLRIHWSQRRDGWKRDTKVIFKTTDSKE